MNSNSKLDQPRSHAYKKLLYDELIPQNLEESSSEVHQRTSISAEYTSNSSSSILSVGKKSKFQNKRLNSWFGTFYKAWMFVLTLLYGISTLLQTFGIIARIGINLQAGDILKLIIYGIGFAQSLIAFSGARQGSFEKIEKALQIMKIWFGFLALSVLNILIGVEVHHVKDDKPFSDPRALLAVLVLMGLAIILNILPTKKVRNILGSQPDEVEPVVQEIPTSSSPTPSESQQKGLNSLFGMCYKTWMFIVAIYNALTVVEVLIRMIDNPDEKLMKLIILLLIFVCGLIQSILALIGVLKQNLRKIEMALMLMKVSVGLEALRFLRNLIFELNCLPDLEDSEAYYDFKHLWIIMAAMSFTIILIIIPTRKAMKRLRSTLQSKENDQIAIMSPVEKLNSRGYIIYKYWALICFFWSFKDIVELFGEDPYEQLNVLRKLTFDIGDINRCIDFLTVLLICLLAPVYSFFAFEGIRRKSLKNILRAIQVMKINFVLNLIAGASALFLVDTIGTLEDLETNELTRGLFKKYDIYSIYIFASFLSLFKFYMTFMYGAFKVRDVLKALKKEKKE